MAKFQPKPICRASLRLRFDAVALAFALLLAFLVSCSGSKPIDTAGDSDGQAVVTTNVEPPADEVGDPQSYRSPTRIPVLEGKAVATADAEATEAGWLVVLIYDVDAPRPDRPADYDAHVMGLYVRDQVVIEAWTGG